MIKAIAIDDEPIALEIIKNHSAKIPFVEIRGVFTDAFKAMEFLQNEKVDLIFLDIKMPDISGIDLLKSILHPPLIIFTTAYSEHAMQGFELDAIDYLLKPFSQVRFLKACNKAYDQYRLRNDANQQVNILDSIFVKCGYDQIRITLDDILYVESSGNYMQFVLKDQKILSRLTMNETLALLPAYSFLRIHRSFIVSKKQIMRIEKNAVWIKQTELPVGASYLREIQKIAER